jgi:hypothetical protein
MSVQGQTRKSGRPHGRSVLRLEADIVRLRPQVRSVPFDAARSKRLGLQVGRQPLISKV